MRLIVYALIHASLAIGTYAIAAAIAGPPEPADPVLLPDRDLAIAKALDPKPAIVLTRFGNSQCTGCIVGPRRKAGDWLVFTAAHCGPVGAKGTIRVRDGRTLAVRVAAASSRSDGALLLTEVKTVASLPFATLATRKPKPREPVYHNGYGIDRPGNIEKGYVRNPMDTNGQTEFWLSVSPGDSGGPIVSQETGEVLASTCCTTRLAGEGRVWGCSALAASDLVRQLDGKAPQQAKLFASSPVSPRPAYLLVPSLHLAGRIGGHP